MDFSPILAFLALNIVGGILDSLARATLVQGF
jgi:YggT family protein